MCDSPRLVSCAPVRSVHHPYFLVLLYLQARRVRTALAEQQQSRDELRRALPYGYQFHSDWLTRLEVLRGAAAGLEYMHAHDVIHRDLTSYNLLLDFGKPWQVSVWGEGSSGAHTCSCHTAYMRVCVWWDHRAVKSVFYGWIDKQLVVADSAGRALTRPAPARLDLCPPTTLCSTGQSV